MIIATPYAFSGFHIAEAKGTRRSARARLSATRRPCAHLSGSVDAAVGFCRDSVLLRVPLPVDADAGVRAAADHARDFARRQLQLDVAHAAGHAPVEDPGRQNQLVAQAQAQPGALPWRVPCPSCARSLNPRSHLRQPTLDRPQPATNMTHGDRWPVLYCFSQSLVRAPHRP